MITPDRSGWVREVVVGVDGSESSLAALDVAVREAVLRRCGLRVVHAFVWPQLHVPLGPSPIGPIEGGLSHQAERILSSACERARASASGIAVSGEMLTGYPAAVLLGCVDRASLVVIGDRGLGGFTGLLVGSVAAQLTAHAPCPVLVVRGSVNAAAPVLLGVDGAPASDAAVGFGFEEAALRGVPLVALHAWTHPVSTGPGDVLPLVYDVPEVESEEARLLAEALAGWHEKYPDVVVRRALAHAGARKALIEASTRAQLVVVGARGRGEITGLLLGSVSQAVLHHAACPVAVVRSR